MKKNEQIMPSVNPVNKLTMAVEQAEREIEWSLQNLQQFADKLIRHAREAEEFVRATKAGEPFSTSWITFAEANAQDAMLELTRLEMRREKLRTLRYLSRNDDQK